MSEWDLACYQRRCDMAKNVVKIIMKGSIDEQNRVMNPVLDITKLTRAEKLRAMEELWEDLSRPEAEYENMNRQSGMGKCFERVKRMSRLAGMSLCRGRQRNKFAENR